MALFNNYNDGLSGENYIGQDLYQSGTIAAGLIDKSIAKSANIAIVQINAEKHIRQKERGFRDYLKRRGRSGRNN